MIEFGVRRLREMKGAPLSVLIALWLSRPVGVSGEWLQATTGYTDKPVRLALLYLREHGFVVKSSGGWILGEGFQLPLPYDYPTVVRNNSESPININRESLKEDESLININSQGRNYSDFPEVGQALLDAGIEENWRTCLLLDQISVRDIYDAIAKITLAGHAKSETGYLIRVLEGIAEQNKRELGDSLARYKDWED